MPNLSMNTTNLPLSLQQAMQESHLRRLEQQQRQQLASAFSAYAGRPFWIPSMVSVPAVPAPEPSLLSCQPCPPRSAVTAPAAPQSRPMPAAAAAAAKTPEQPKPSADEVCAASVLLGLTSKERTASNAPSPVPNMVDETIHIPKSIRDETPGHVTDSSASSAASHHSVMEEDASVCNSAEEKPIPVYPPDQKWHTGCVSLSLPEDEEVLSPLHCFMRRYCVEAFTAAPEDVATPRYGKSHGLKVVAGQVGIRCMYCKHRPVGKRPERAVCYPSSLKNIYHSIETWQRRHSLVCPDIPAWVRQSMVELMESSKSRAGGRRQYWEDSATRLGMVDTISGVRFIREPGAVETAPPANTTGFVPKKVVLEEDKEMVTDYLFLLMDQMETCQFTEEDRSGGRSKIKNNTVGFPGMQCKHCQGKAGFGRYFPSSVNALALANSDRNINNHLQKCRRCPTDIKQELNRLAKDSSQGKNRRGLRKLFFRRVWERMHGPLDA